MSKRKNNSTKKSKKKEEKRLSVQKTIRYKQMGKDGICRVQGTTYSKCIRFYDINYQLAQNEDKNAIFENWCDFLNYFDSSIHFQLSFINHKSNMKEFENVIRIRPQHDEFDDVRMEYAQMLKHQLAKGNNGLVKSKYITFSIEAENIKLAKPKLERIESDILNNFKVLGVPAYPLNGVERLQIMYETFSALGTVGLTMGITEGLTLAGKIIIIASMYCGRLGPITMAMVMNVNSKNKKVHRKLPEGKIFV